jgi:hypothetical protein
MVYNIVLIALAVFFILVVSFLIGGIIFIIKLKIMEWETKKSVKKGELLSIEGRESLNKEKLE